MKIRRSRLRVIDVAVALVAMALVALPLAAGAFAGSAGGPLIQDSFNIDQKVVESGMISNPLSLGFTVDRSGTSSGTAQWDVFTSADSGFKLVLSSTTEPALRDGNGSSDVADFDASVPTAWSVGSGERRFGFSATGDHVLASYDSGTRYRGLQGRRGVEVTRRTPGPVQRNRTTVRLRSEMKDSLPSSADPQVAIVATAVANL